MVQFVKNLSTSEAKYKYVGLPKSMREEFPAKDEIFKLKFKDGIYDMKVNNKDCIMLTQLYEKHRFIENDEIIITDGKKGVFDLIVKSHHV